MVEKAIRRKWQRANRKSWNRRPKIKRSDEKRKGKPTRREKRILRKLKRER